MKVATLIVTSLAVASGANLRTTQEFALAQASVETLAARYNCRDASGDLVKTVNNIIDANKADKEASIKKYADDKAAHVKSRDAAKIAHDMALTTALGKELTTKKGKKSAAMDAVAQAKSDFCVADFSMDVVDCGTDQYGSTIAPSKLAADAAKEKAELASKEAETAVNVHNAKKVTSSGAKAKFLVDTNALKKLADDKPHANIFSASFSPIFKRAL